MQIEVKCGWFLTEELKKHNIEIIRGAISRCGTHEGIVYKDLATGKCMIGSNVWYSHAKKITRLIGMVLF